MEKNTMEENRSSAFIDLNSFPVDHVLNILLKDKTTKRSIIFATDAYHIGDDQIDPLNPVQPRCFKSRSEQADRTRKNAEVFTPVWICNRMNNFCDEEWFGRKDVFNAENGHDHIVTEGPVLFPEGKRWQKYVDSRRLEIICG